jgi:hypothetical protein
MAAPGTEVAREFHHPMAPRAMINTLYHSTKKRKVTYCETNLSTAFTSTGASDV